MTKEEADPAEEMKKEQLVRWKENQEPQEPSRKEGWGRATERAGAKQWIAGSGTWESQAHGPGGVLGLKPLQNGFKREKEKSGN